jgi:hypothetical protein
MNCGGHLRPLGTLADKLFAAQRSEPVILEFSIAFFGHFPFRGDPIVLHEAMKSRVERAVLDLKHLVAGALNVFCDGMAVRWTGQQGAEDQHIQRALQEFGAVLSLFFHDSRESTILGRSIVDVRLWKRFLENLIYLEGGFGTLCRIGMSVKKGITSEEVSYRFGGEIYGSAARTRIGR